MESGIQPYNSAALVSQILPIFSSSQAETASAPTSDILDNVNPEASSLEETPAEAQSEDVSQISTSK